MIPLSFEYEGIHFEATLERVKGRYYEYSYDLMINNKYRGQLWKGEQGWQFKSNDGWFEDIAWWFIEQVENSL